MALRDQPYLPLYIQDYLTDEKLNECSPATQGVYIKLLCVLHKMEEYGTILLKQSDKQSNKQTKNFAIKFARQIAFTVDTIEAALDELVDNKVMTIDGDILYQKRMVKDNKLSIVRAESGKKGGETTWKKPSFAKANAKAKAIANSESEYENESIYNDAFNKFWEAYPKKRSKGQAEKAFKKLKPDDLLLKTILEKIELLKLTDDWKKDKGQFIPYPATWLNAKGWEDEIEAEKKSRWS